MPLLDNTPAGFSLSPTINNEEGEGTAGFVESFAAGFRMENDVLAFMDLATRPRFSPDESYEVGNHLLEYDRENRTSFFENYRDNFVGSQSRDETMWIMGRIIEEEKDRTTAARNGFAGLAGAIAGGILSPTSFIPLVGPATRVKTAWQFAKEAAMLGTAVGVVQEGVLQAAQETRSWEESAIGVAQMTMLSGLLGGAVGYLARGEAEAIARSMNESQLMTMPVTPGSMGAAAVTRDSAGGLASGAVTAQRILDSNALTRNPVTFNIQQPMRTVRRGATVAQEPVDYLQSRTARDAMTLLSDGSLQMQRNAEGVPTAGGTGGTIENRIAFWYSGYSDIAKNLDEGFLDYRLNGAPPTITARAGVRLADTFNQTNGKLSKSEYRAELSRALRSNDEHEIPQIASTAKYIRSRLFDPMLREAQRAGIIGDDIDLKGDASWILRDYNREAISRNTVEFVDELARHFQKILEDEFAEAASRMKARRARTEETVQDLQRPVEEVTALRQQFLDELKQMEESEQFAEVEDAVAELRSAARLAEGAERRRLLDDARAMERAQGEAYQGFTQRRADVRRRLRSLNRSIVQLEKRQAAKLEAVERIDELNMNALRRAARAGAKFAQQMDRWSDERLDAEVAKLRNQFARLGEQFDRGEERIAKLADDPESARLLALDEAQQVRAEKMTSVAERLADAEDLGRDALRSLINDMLEETLQRINEKNSRRVMRQQRLIAQAEGLDPATAAARIEGLRNTQAQRELDLVDNWRMRGADDLDLEAGRGDFARFARERAFAAKDKIMGTHLRLPSLSRMPGERGSEIDRVLSIPSQNIEKFLDNDVERLIRTTLRTLGPDIEIAKKFGDIGLSRVLGEKGGLPGELADEMNAQLERIAKSDLSPAVKERRTKEINDTFAAYRKNIEAVVGRLRHTWGLPQDPEALGYRLGRLMLNLNVLRLMGGVVISSIPDVARPVMRYGLTRVMRDGFLPLITNFKQMRLTMNEVKALAGGLDATMQSRAAALFDIMDDMNRGTKFEKGVEYATNRFGLVALFDYWTNAMKQFSGAVAHAKFMDSLDAVMTGARGIDKEEAIRYLAQNDIGEDMAQRIWAEMMKEGGATRVDGRWWPNTENWAPDVRQAYSAAIVREVNQTIITPGVDRPLWMDQTMMGKVLGQFKSFAVASTTKTMLAGMQQRDAAVMQGVLLSLSMGALSYYLYAVAAGGKTLAEMESAGPDKWADEAIARSGLLGMLAEVQRIAERIPATQPYATFSGTRSARRGGDNLVEAIFGPSFDLVGTSARALATAGDMTESDVHATRTLLPGQNVFYLRQLFDVMEQVVPARSN